MGRTRSFAEQVLRQRTRIVLCAGLFAAVMVSASAAAAQSRSYTSDESKRLSIAYRSHEGGRVRPRYGRTQPFRQYHTVAEGENLYRIALRYGVTVSALMQANDIRDPRELRAGRSLLIPAPGDGGEHTGAIDFGHAQTPGQDEDREEHPEKSHLRTEAKPFPKSREGYRSHRPRGSDRLFPIDGPEGSLRPQPSKKSDLRRLGRALVEPPGSHAAFDSEMPAGYTFLAQFIEQDLGFGLPPSRQGWPAALDLDNLYGGGPHVSPRLYHLPYLRAGRRIYRRGRYVRYDVIDAGRTLSGLIADPRINANFIVAQLYAAFVAFHNRIVNLLIERHYDRERYRYCDRPCSNAELAGALPRRERRRLFEEARETVIHYYHRIIVEDFLPRVIGIERTRDILLNGRDFYFPGGFKRHDGSIRAAYIPVEFATAAFRYADSQIRQDYVLREGERRGLFENGGSRHFPEEITAFPHVSPDLLVDWRYFFDIDPTPPRGFNYARKIDPLAVPALHNLDEADMGRADEPGSMPARELMRGRFFNLPSGQAIAEKVLPALQQRGALNIWRTGVREKYAKHGQAWYPFWLPPDKRTQEVLGIVGTPLWYYVLQEAETFGEATGFAPRDTGYALSQAHPLRRYAAVDNKPLSDQTSHAGTQGHTLGPVGGTIVGEVLTGLIEHYGLTTGRGLAYRPEIGASSYGEPGLLTLTPVEGGTVEPDERYLMRNLLIDAGVAWPL